MFGYYITEMHRPFWILVYCNFWTKKKTLEGIMKL